MAIEEPNKQVPVKSREVLYGDDASEETKKQIEALFETAQAVASKEDYNQAISIYGKIVKLNEKSTAAWIAMGHCFAMLDDNNKALQSYQQALSITPESQKDDQLWYGIGLLYQKIEDWKNAETSFRNALKLNPSQSLKGEILYHLGVIMKVRGDHQEAIKMLTNSILLGSFSVDKMIDILCNIGTSLEELNEMNEAMQTYKYALMLDENNIRALQCIGWLYFQLDKINEANEHLNKAGALNEEDCNTLYMKARCHLKLNNHTKAYECLNKCLTKDCSNSIFWCSLGILFAELTQLKSAHECLSNALKFNPKSADNYFNMGCLFELASQWNDAILMYDKALEIQPNFHLAQTRKQGVYTQIENRNTSLEVQFKHHKFVLSFAKDIDKEKPLFFFSQATQGLFPNATETANATNDFFPVPETKTMEKINIGEQVSQHVSPPKQDQQPAGNNSASIPSLQTLIPQISGISSVNNKVLNLSGSTQKLPQQLASTPTATKPSVPQQQQQPSGSFLSSWNPFQAVKQSLNNPTNLGGMLSILSSNKASSNSEQVPASQSLSGLLTEQNKSEDLQSGMNEKSGEKRPNEGFVASKSTNLLSEAPSDQGSFKANRNLASPIVLKHDPQVLNDKKEEEQKSKGQDGQKPQKTGFKLTNKGIRGDEGLIPQKKVKLDNEEAGSPQGQGDKQNKKASSLVLRQSPLNK